MIQKVQYPPYQRGLRWLLFTLGGIIGFGVLLDSIGNALSLINEAVTYIGTAIIVLSWIVTAPMLKTFVVEWRTKDGQKVRIIRLGDMIKGGLAGVLILLWVPQIISKPKDDLQKLAQIYMVAGTVFLDGMPLPDARITLVGIEGEWYSKKDGTFHFQSTNFLSLDSVRIIITHTMSSETLRLDTTVAKTNLQALRLHLNSTKTCIVDGHVIEEGSGRPVAGAKIVLGERRGAGETDSIGYFQILAAGKSDQQVDVTITHERYVSRMLGVTLSKQLRIPLSRKK